MAGFFKTVAGVADNVQKGLNNSIQRRLHPERYLLQNKSPRVELLRDGVFSVHYYPPLGEPRIEVEGETIEVAKTHYKTPLLLVPPLGVYAWIFDLMQERSLVRYFQARGFEVYLIDWGRPDRNEAELSLEQYTLRWFPQAVRAVQFHSGEKDISVLGYCMGGLLSLMYTAAAGHDVVKNLVTIASPINLHQVLGGIGKVAMLVSGPTGLIRRLTGPQLVKLNPGLFHVDGRILSLMFKATAPMAAVMSYLDLIRHLADDEYVSRYMTMNEWFTNMPDYPGATVLEVIQKMGLANRMQRGYFSLGEYEISFKRITSALLSLAGDQDVIATVSSASAIMGVVGSKDKTFQVVPGGHAGVFTGSRAAHTTWVIAADWLSLRSGEAVVRVSEDALPVTPTVEVETVQIALPGLA